MIHHYVAPWLLDREDPQDARDRMHRVALREARIAAEYRTAVAGTIRAVAVERRAALALAGTRSGADLAACCA